VPGTAERCGAARIAAGPGNGRAEYAVFGREDMAGRGLGTTLLKRIVAYARSGGISGVFGDVLKDNTAMLALCDDLGFSTRPDPEDASIVKTSIAP